jgi:hypothetical protein
MIQRIPDHKDTESHKEQLDSEEQANRPNSITGPEYKQPNSKQNAGDARDDLKTTMLIAP